MTQSGKLAVIMMEFCFTLMELSLLHMKRNVMLVGNGMDWMMWNVETVF